MPSTEIKPDPGRVAAGSRDIHTGIRREMMHREREAGICRQANVDHLATHSLQSQSNPGDHVGGSRPLVIADHYDRGRGSRGCDTTQRGIPRLLIFFIPQQGSQRSRPPDRRVSIQLIEIDAAKTTRRANNLVLIGKCRCGRFGKRPILLH